jgi:hypothetical protein
MIFDMQEWMYEWVEEHKDKQDDGTIKVSIFGEDAVIFDDGEDADDFLWNLAPDEYHEYMSGYGEDLKDE